MAIQVCSSAPNAATCAQMAILALVVLRLVSRRLLHGLPSQASDSTSCNMSGLFSGINCDLARGKQLRSDSKCSVTGRVHLATGAFSVVLRLYLLCIARTCRPCDGRSTNALLRKLFTHSYTYYRARCSAIVLSRILRTACYVL